VSENKELPTPAEIHATAMEKGWKTVGVEKSYSTKSKIILFHPDRKTYGKIYYNSKEIPEITP
jgi:hypothetical protein